jgi:hypothetical protein
MLGASQATVAGGLLDTTPGNNIECPGQHPLLPEMTKVEE